MSKMMARLLRILLLCAPVLVLGGCTSRLSAQTTASNPERTNTTPANRSRKTDRRDAIANGSWSPARVSLFYTWMAWDSNTNRHIRLNYPGRHKVIEITGEIIRLLAG